MYLAIIILSLLGSIASGFFGRKIGVTGSQIITCTAVIMTTVFAIVAFFEVGLNNIPVSIELFRWIDSESLYVSWGFHFDSLTVSILIPVLIVFSLVHIYCSLPEGYKQYYKHLKLSVFVFGASTIIHTLGLNAIHSCLLIIVILVIIGFLHFWISYIAFLDNSALFIIVTVYILTDSLMTAEFCENFLNLSHIDLFLLHLGMARIIIGIVITKHQPSFFDRLKNTTELFLPYLKKNPMFYIIIGISVLLLFMITTNLLCWSLGLTLCKDNFFTFYIFIITKLILVNSTISLIMLAYTPSSMWYSIIAMSIWLPLFSIPFSFFYYFYVIPVLINLQWIPIQIDDLKANLSFSEPLFFLAARNMGDQLINMPNRLGQLGKLLTQWANWALDYKPESIRGRNTSANRTQKLGVGFYATNKNHLEHNYNKVSHWAMVKGWPKAAPVGISLPFSAKGSNTIDRGSNIINSSLCYKSISSCIVFTNFSLEVFNGSFHTFIQKSQNVSGFFSTMKNLAEVKFILSANSTVEFKWIGQNIVKVVCNDNSRAGFLESYKDIVKMDFIPGLASSIGPDCNLDVKEIEYSNPDTIFDIQAWLNGLTSKCSQTFASTEPNKIGFDCNPHVHMEWNPNYNNANEYNITNPDHSVRGDLLENTDYLDPNVIGDLLENTDYLDPNVIGDSENTNRVVSKELIREEGIEVRIHDLDPCWVYLKYDLSRLSGYTQDDNHDWKIYLHNILTEIRKVLIKFWGDDQDITEKATMANIDPDYGNDTVAVKEHFHALGRAINVVGGGNVDLNNFHLLGEKFVQSLNPYVYFSDAEESQLEYIGDPTISQLEDIENPTISQLEDIENPTVLSNNNLTVDTTGEISLSTPLAYSEIHDLTSELRDRLSKAESDRLNLSGSGMPVDKYKHNLYSLGMSVDKYGDKIVIRCNNKKDVHFLLSRLANTNKDIFTWKKNGDIKPGSNYVKPIITKLEQLMFDKLMSDNDPIDLSTPLAYSEIQDLINELRSRVSKVESDRLNLYSLGMSVSKSGGRIVILCNDKKDVHVLLSRLANTNKDIFTVKDGYIQPANSYIKTMYAKLEQWMFNYTPTVE